MDDALGAPDTNERVEGNQNAGNVVRVDLIAQVWNGDVGIVQAGAEADPLDGDA